MFEGVELVEFIGKCIVLLVKGIFNEIVRKCVFFIFVN